MNPATPAIRQNRILKEIYCFSLIDDTISSTTDTQFVRLYSSS